MYTLWMWLYINKELFFIIKLIKNQTRIKLNPIFICCCVILVLNSIYYIKFKYEKFEGYIHCMHIKSENFVDWRNSIREGNVGPRQMPSELLEC